MVFFCLCCKEVYHLHALDCLRLHVCAVMLLLIVWWILCWMSLSSTPLNSIDDGCHSFEMCFDFILDPFLHIQFTLDFVPGMGCSTICVFWSTICSTFEYVEQWLHKLSFFHVIYCNCFMMENVSCVLYFLNHCCWYSSVCLHHDLIYFSWSPFCIVCFFFVIVSKEILQIHFYYLFSVWRLNVFFFSVFRNCLFLYNVVWGGMAVYYSVIPYRLIQAKTPIISE